MTRIIIVALALAFLAPSALLASTPPAASPAAPSNRIVLPGGTQVTVVLSGKISSSTANVGDTFDIESSQDVIVDGWIVIKKGAPGQGEILAVDRAGSHGHPGSLGVQMDWIYSVDGHKVKLTSQRKTEEGQGNAGAASTATILSYVFLGPLGLFAHNFVKGHDVVVDSSHPLPAYIDDSVYVIASERGEGPDSNFAQAVDATPTAMPVASSTSNRASSPADIQNQTAAMPVAPQADSPTQTLIDVEGNQPKQTAKFSAPASWSIQYTFDCSASPKDTPTGFSILVSGVPVEPIIHAGESGMDLVAVHGSSGPVSLSIQSHCVWHVRALSQSTAMTP